MARKVTLQVQQYRNQGNGSKHVLAYKNSQEIIVMTGGLPTVIGFAGVNQIERRKAILYLANVMCTRT